MLPQLVTLYGENDKAKTIMTESDYRLLMGGGASPAEIERLEQKYPELLGIFPLLPFIPAAAAAAKKLLQKKLIPAAARAIAKKTGKPAKAPAKTPAKMPAKTGAGAAALLKNPLVIAGAAAAVGLLLLTGKKKNNRLGRCAPAQVEYFGGGEEHADVTKSKTGHYWAYWRDYSSGRKYGPAVTYYHRQDVIESAKKDGFTGNVLPKLSSKFKNISFAEYIRSKVTPYKINWL